MRIVGGKHKGRVFNPPMKKWKTRPTTDFAKEGLFNVLQNYLDLSACSAIDLFAGTGNISFELLSRGVNSIQIVEKYGPCIAFIKSIMNELDNDESNIVYFKGDVFKFLNTSRSNVDLVFADPPYDFKFYPKLVEKVLELKGFNEGGLFVLEHDKRNHFEDHSHFDFSRIYGNVIFSFFRAHNPN